MPTFPSRNEGQVKFINMVNTTMDVRAGTDSFVLQPYTVIQSTEDTRTQSNETYWNTVDLSLQIEDTLIFNQLFFPCRPTTTTWPLLKHFNWNCPTSLTRSLYRTAIGAPSSFRTLVTDPRPHMWAYLADGEQVWLKRFFYRPTSHISLITNKNNTAETFPLFVLILYVWRF